MKTLSFICHCVAFLTINVVSNAQVKLLNPATQPQFVNALPIPAVVQPIYNGGIYYEISMTQFKQDLGLKDSAGNTLLTTVWGFNGSYPGPTIEAWRNQPFSVRWKNELKDINSRPIVHPLPVDTSLHWAKPQGWPQTGVPTVVHMHGGHSESASDGLPESWYTPDFVLTGPTYKQQVCHYAMDQEAATIWYHDHALGITRLNVYMGLAGFCIIRDSAEEKLNLPKGDYEIPIVIQDRMFLGNGSLFYPTKLDSSGNPTIEMEPEMAGDFILVNGKTWPVLDVEPRKYRLRFLNGSDSRFYNLSFQENITFHQIGSDGGLLNEPVTLSALTVAPGERKDVIIDFSDTSLWNKTLILKNDARIPFPNGAAVKPGLTDRIMAFRVSKVLSSTDSSVIPQQLRTTNISRLTNAKTTRQLILAEDEDEEGELITMLGTAAEGLMEYADPITENPMLNDVEVWEIINTTPDAHPVHLHLVSFQVINKQKFDDDEFEIGEPNTLQLLGSPIEPEPQDMGWKDTYVANPGEVTRLIAKFQKEGLYVWHCHILSHEDHEMMRPYYVGKMPVAVNTNKKAEVQVVVYPNPFNGNVSISVKTLEKALLQIGIYNLLGEKIAIVQNAETPAGSYNFNWNGKFENGKIVPAGVYLCRIVSGENEVTYKLIRTK